MEEDFEPAVQHQRRVNPKIHDVIKQEVIKLLKAGLIYPISDSPWVSPVHCVPKKGGFTVVKNEDNELIPTRLMLKRLAGNKYYYFLDDFSGYFQIPIDPKDQEKTTFTCPYRTFAYRRMPFGLCNAPSTFQRCMMAIFHDMIEKATEVFMDDFSVFGNSFQSCLSHLERMLKRPMTRLLEKDTLFIFSQKCVEAFQTLKRKLTKAPILIASDWDMPFELMYNASDFAIGAVLGQHQDKHFRPIHYASKVMTEAKSNYTTTEKEMLAVVSSEGVYLARKPLKISGLVIMDPQETSGQVEVSNRGLKRIMERAVSENRASWSDKLDDALWAFHIAYKTPIRCTPYKLVYEKACHLPVELEHKVYWALKHANFDLKTAGDHRKVQINELNELHDQAYENSLIYKEITKRLHDSKIKNYVFNISDRVLLFNSRLTIFSGKLKSYWSGPFTISQVYPYGTVELSQPDGPNFKVSGHRLKHYFGEDVPKVPRWDYDPGKLCCCSGFIELSSRELLLLLFSRQVLPHGINASDILPNNTTIPNAEPNTAYGPTPQGPTLTEPSSSPQSTLPTLIAYNHASGPSTSAHQTSPLLPRPLIFDFPNPQPNTKPVHEHPRTYPMITRSQSALLQQIIGSLNNELDMTDLRALNYFLGIFADRTPTSLFLSQKKYALQLLERAHMVTCNPSRTSVDTESKLGPKVEHETKVTKDTVHPTNNVSTKYIQPSVVQTESPILNPELVVAPIIEPVVAPFADIFTKGLPSAFFEDFRSILSVRPLPALTARAY
nr:reverse transcriptase domain-containing protein [Tanacetum cinerariifolium]